MTFKNVVEMSGWQFDCHVWLSWLMVSIFYHDDGSAPARACSGANTFKSLYSLCMGDSRKINDRETCWTKRRAAGVHGACLVEHWLDPRAELWLRKLAAGEIWLKSTGFNWLKSSRFKLAFMTFLQVPGAIGRRGTKIAINLMNNKNLFYCLE